MRTLIAEDDVTCCLLLTKILSPYGECVGAENGRITFEKFKQAHAEHKPFSLICLDIMMPEMDGQEVLSEVRAWEQKHGILGLDGIKIIMTTALNDSKSIMQSFRSQCEGYIVKPIDKNKLLNEIRLLGLL